MAITQHHRERRPAEPAETSWPEASSGLSEVDDETFTRAILEGRQRELTPSR